MPGIAKRKYVEELMRFNKQLKNPLNKLKSILPQEYSPEIIVSEFKALYPLLWKELLERYEQYQSKDKFLVKIGKKPRYNSLPPEQYLLTLPQIKQWLSLKSRENHKEQFDEDIRTKNRQSLILKMNAVVSKHENKIHQNTEDIQHVEPLYIDAFITAYHQKGINTEGKIEIFNELKKYLSPKTINFFYKLNDAEKNNQVRSMAFIYLQSIGKYVKLRKNFKGKQKSYMLERADFNLTPIDLWNRIEKNKIQNSKRFHFFISHSSFDKSHVLSAIKSLNQYSYSVYCDWTSDNDFLKRELVSEYTKRVLMKRLDQSDNILLIKSKDSLNSEWVSFELDYFKKLKKPIFFIEIDEYFDSRLDDFILLDLDNIKGSLI